MNTNGQTKKKFHVKNAGEKFVIGVFLLKAPLFWCCKCCIFMCQVACAFKEKLLCQFLVTFGEEETHRLTNKAWLLGWPKSQNNHGRCKAKKKVLFSQRPPLLFGGETIKRFFLEFCMVSNVFLSSDLHELQINVPFTNEITKL